MIFLFCEYIFVDFLTKNGGTGMRRQIRQNDKRFCTMGLILAVVCMLTHIAIMIYLSEKSEVFLFAIIGLFIANMCDNVFYRTYFLEKVYINMLLHAHLFLNVFILCCLSYCFMLMNSVSCLYALIVHMIYCLVYTLVGVYKNMKFLYKEHINYKLTSAV